MESALEEKARKFAEQAHARVSQVRKYTGEPYVTHPAAVVAIVRAVKHTKDMIAAAWLHDTVEDTGAAMEEIEAEFGAEVAAMVEQLTDVSKLSDGNRKVRKAIDLAHTAKASAEAQTIKLADLIDNTRNIVERDPEFAKVYFKEKELLLEVLTEGDLTLWNVAKGILSRRGWPQIPKPTHTVSPQQRTKHPPPIEAARHKNKSQITAQICLLWIDLYL